MTLAELAALLNMLNALIRDIDAVSVLVERHVRERHAKDGVRSALRAPSV
jgi:hypothetical protein